MDKTQVGSPFECYGVRKFQFKIKFLKSESFKILKISIQIEKEVIIDSNGEPVVSQEGKTEYRSGFKVGGGIDQDHTKSPQQYKDNVYFML
jgi:hypothetical protein